MPSTSAQGGNSAVTREQLIQGLQEDLAREYKAIVQYVIFSQKLDGARYMNIADQLGARAPGAGPRAHDRAPARLLRCVSHAQAGTDRRARRERGDAARRSAGGRRHHPKLS